MTCRAYENRAVETAQVIQELIDLAKEMQEASRRGESLNLTDDELAFYDALAANESAKDILSDEASSTIAKEPVVRIRKSATIDWTIKKTVRAGMRAMVRRLLRKHGCPCQSARRTVDENPEYTWPACPAGGDVSAFRTVATDTRGSLAHPRGAVGLGGEGRRPVRT